MYDILKKRFAAIQAEISETRSKLRTLPKGSLQYHKNGKYLKLFQRLPDGSINGKRIYLGKDKRRLAGRLALKKYLETKLKDLLRENSAISNYFAVFDGVYESRKLFDHSEALRSLLPSEFLPLSSELARWAGEPFPSSAAFPENLLVRAPHGMVRSKSEAIISWELFENKIPYRYECDLSTPFGILHPNFTIRHPKTGELYIWEHFGLIDDPPYLSSALSKVRTYISLGYLPSNNLILTYETASAPLDIEYVKMLIEYSFL